MINWIKGLFKHKHKWSFYQTYSDGTKSEKCSKCLDIREVK